MIRIAISAILALLATAAAAQEPRGVAFGVVSDCGPNDPKIPVRGQSGIMCLSDRFNVGRDQVRASVSIGAPSGQPVVMLSLPDALAQKISTLTAANITKQMAIVVNGQIVTAATIREPIKGAVMQISSGALAQAGAADALAAEINQAVAQ